ncbi:Methyltransferase domain-containing protein [Rhodoblastus acidophilus]|uniref:Methyltransferase domain-containing protein n=1 Tax=Rhodoblastus acidophilus TaxID=1074 RepID=A0A212QLN9_RHOAC|nr:class I SAM-dependent methyltransferase [Rhodoblastus acidophilus]PPQ39831.1 class I SAM-dependent methyltransferase [Rhodoblastus acidophilus]RAI23807.1 methyltransferase type 11 [Rhodoblastus acidophilus]SNB60264.1 Methyltransferase domain-containing protein [Rhodoblastus acidophilus]
MTGKDELKAQFRAMARGAQTLGLGYIGVVNGLFAALRRLDAASADDLAQTAGMDAGYVRRWCDGAYAFGLLEAEGDLFGLSEMGAALDPEIEGTLMPVAGQAMMSMHMAERAADFMRTGARPGEQVMFERPTLGPLFGAMLEASFTRLFSQTIAPSLPVVAEIAARGGLVVDLGCGNGWCLRALLRDRPLLRGLGFDGFDGNIAQARALAEKAGMSDRLRFAHGDLHDAKLEEKADLIVMNRALHHVWEAGPQEFMAKLRDALKPGGAVAIWEPDWPEDRALLRTPARQGFAFQNLSEHVQGNHLLQATEIAAAFKAAGMTTEIFRFAEGQEAVIVARSGC